jgi:hypothetical protein
LWCEQNTKNHKELTSGSYTLRIPKIFFGPGGKRYAFGQPFFKTQNPKVIYGNVAVFLANSINRIISFGFILHPNK